jgi:hypothetical protein
MGKGGAFEREISKEFSQWLTDGKMDDAVWHTSGSGGRATQRKKNNNEVKRYDHGDLRPDHECTNFFFDIFNVELKTGYAKITKKKGQKTITMWSFNDLIDSKQDTPIFNSFWEQCCTDSISSKREPLLIFRRTQRTACIAMNDYIFESFKELCGKPIFNYILINTKNNIVVCNLYQFYNWTWTKIRTPKFKLYMNKAITSHK